MGCILSCVSEILYIGEKFVLYAACTSLIVCLVITIIVTLGMGVGLGYNYCFVDMKTKYKYVPGRYIFPGRIPYDTRYEDDPDIERLAEADALTELPLSEQNPTPLPSMFNSLTNEMLMNRPSYLEDNETEIENNQPVFSDSEPFNVTTSLNVTKSLNGTTLLNGTKSFVDVLVDAVTKHDKITESSQSVTKTNGTTITRLPWITLRSIERPREVLNESDKPTSEATIVYEPNNRKVKKLVIPISGVDLISLLSTLKAENKNYSLQLLTT